MKILKRLRIIGHRISIMETGTEIFIEFPLNISEFGKTQINKYLEEEGILEEILSGNTHFELNEIAYVDTHKAESLLNAEEDFSKEIEKNKGWDGWIKDMDEKDGYL